MLSKVSINFSYLRSKCVIVLPYTKIHPRISGHLGSLSHVKKLGKIHAGMRGLENGALQTSTPPSPKNDLFSHRGNVLRRKSQPTIKYTLFLGREEEEGRSEFLGNGTTLKLTSFVLLEVHHN